MIYDIGLKKYNIEFLKEEIYEIIGDRKLTGWDQIHLQKGSDPVPENHLDRLRSMKDPIFEVPYLNSILEELKMYRSKIYILGSKRCYTYHRDLTNRLHIPIVTHPHSFFVLEDKIEHLKADGNYYIIDTTKNHTAMNCSEIDRIHIIGLIDK